MVSDPTLAMCTVMGNSATTTINNEIIGKNSILQDTSMISEYSYSVTDSVTIFWLRKRQAITDQSIRTMYSVTLFWVSLSYG